ncbi:hypothetical protein, partial [Streptomyces sp. NPDC006195]|uniref:hypothetical protein n=1 Tax=Streptomyces sp. NPDC006195 TaxID=3154581 RepID=UPI0033BD7443
EGAVVVVSHDRGFRARFTGGRLELRAGRVVSPAGRGATVLTRSRRRRGHRGRSGGRRRDPDLRPL